MGAYRKFIENFFAEHAGEYDVVHLHEIYLSSIIFPIAKRNGIQVRISHSHTTRFSDKKLNAIRNSVLFFPARFLSSHFFGCSRAAGIAAFGRRRTNSDRFFFLKNAIETENFLYSEDNRTKIRKELGWENNFIVGHIGRFAPAKNHMFLLEIFAKLKDKAPDARLLLIGDGPMFHDVQKRAEELGVAGSVLQLGIRKDVSTLMSAMDVFVLPSFFEGLPVALVEAQSNGLPCVVSATITKETKILSNYHIHALSESPETWADTILKCSATRISDPQPLIAEAGYELSSAAKVLYQKYNTLCDECQRSV